jgi:hypothetical protein
MLSKKYRTAGPHFASDVIAGEAVIINLEKGSYYSLDQAGAEIWSALESGATDREVLAGLLAHYSGERHGIEAAMRELIAQLEAEGILIEDEALDSAESCILPESPNGALPAFRFRRCRSTPIWNPS